MLGISSAAHAQGHVFGTVKDPDDRPIKGATITAENPNAAPVVRDLNHRWQGTVSRFSVFEEGLDD